MLNKLAQRFGGDNVGLYRDDGLLLLKGTGGRQAELARKQLHETFKKFNLRITAEINYHTVNFLDVTFDLKEERYIPYRKPNNDPLYIDSRSNHPPCIIKQLPVSINERLCSLSSDEKSFESIAPIYEDALKRSRFNMKLSYSEKHKATPTQSKTTRKRNIIWFNPPYSKNVKTNVAQKFLRLIDKHFPKSSKLHKIFNRNSIKVSYSCMPNVKSNISSHNHRVLKKANASTNAKLCNCRDKNECPLGGKCLTSSVVYQAAITTKDTAHQTKNYIGVTAGPFKERFNNHKKSINNYCYRKETELSKYAWELKEQDIQFDIKWSVIKRVPAYSAGKKSCELCLEEKLLILKSKKEQTLNKRSELFAKCRHKNKFSAQKFQSARINCNSNCKRKRQTIAIKHLT